MSFKRLGYYFEEALWMIGLNIAKWYASWTALDAIGTTVNF